MYGYATAVLGGAANETRVYSPITLSREWPTLWRLLFLVFCACFGSITNGFFVAAFFVEHALKRIGNVFHACVGMADMIITAGVMPMAAVVLLSGEWDLYPVCQILQFLTEASTYCYSIFFTLVAVESFYRSRHTLRGYELFITMRIGLVAMMTYIVGFVIAGVGTYLGLDYDYCLRINYGNYYFRWATFAIFHAIPSSLTFYFLFATSAQIRRRAREQIHYRRSQQYNRDFSMNNLNISAYILYMFGWTPYLIVVYQYPSTSDSKYYHCAWIGICRSLITSILYCSLNRIFRRAFAHLFYYCCCKSNLSSSFHHRHRRGLEYRAGDVRVHIMHQAVTISSPLRGASSSRETQEL